MKWSPINKEFALRRVRRHAERVIDSIENQRRCDALSDLLAARVLLYAALQKPTPRDYPGLAEAKATYDRARILFEQRCICESPQ